MDLAFKLYVQLYAGNVALLVSLSAGLIVYLALRRKMFGEWAMATAAGAAVLIDAISIFTGTRIMIDAFQGMAATGSGGAGSVSAAMAESRFPTIIGTVLCLVLLVVARLSYRNEENESGPGPIYDRAQRSGSMMAILLCLTISVFLLVLNYQLPVFMMNMAFKDTGLSMSEISTSVTAHIQRLFLLSEIAMVVSTVLLLIPLILRTSRPALAGLYSRSFIWALLLVMAIQLGFESYQTNWFVGMAITGIFPGASVAPSAPRQPDNFQDAIRAGDRTAVLKLIKGGQSLNDHNLFLGVTPLMYAIEEGRTDIVKDLLEAGADVNAPGKDGKTALMQAILSNQIPILPDLLKAGAKPDSVDDNGSTALMNAVSAGSSEAVRILLEYGADPNRIDHYGISALAIAQSSKESEIVALLQNAGAKQ